MIISYKNIYSLSEISKVRSDDIDIIVLNYHNVLCFNMTIGVPLALNEARRLSLDSGAYVVMHAIMDIIGEKYVSTIFIKNGEVTGVADCISVGNKFVKGNALRAYEFGKTKIGLVVDDDIMYAGVDNLFACAGSIIHNTLSPIKKEHYAAYKSHIALGGGPYFGLFADCAFFVDKRLVLLPEEGVRCFNLPSKGRPVFRRMLHVSDGE